MINKEKIIILENELMNSHLLYDEIIRENRILKNKIKLKDKKIKELESEKDNYFYGWSNVNKKY